MTLASLPPLKWTGLSHLVSNIVIHHLYVILGGHHVVGRDTSLCWNTVVKRVQHLELVLLVVVLVGPLVVYLLQLIEFLSVLLICT